MPPSGPLFIEEDLNVHYAVDVLGSRQGWNGLASRGFVDIVVVVNPPKVLLTDTDLYVRFWQQLQLAQLDRVRMVPASVSAIADAVQWADEIMKEIDRKWPTRQ
jgi:hypothetical protein